VVCVPYVMSVVQQEGAVKFNLMKIYTKIGDQGKTTFFGCGLIQKNDCRIEAFGALDELNSVLGVTLCFIEDEKLRVILNKIQHDIFQVGADIAGSALKQTALPKIKEEHVKELEHIIDEYHHFLGIPKNFILPGGTVASSFLHMCRAIARRAERTLVSLQEIVPGLNPEVIRYVNRLSDLLFMLARQGNNEVGIKEQQPIYKYFGQDDNG
jgi:cob(I)alamin adenosyltransferase